MAVSPTRALSPAEAAVISRRPFEFFAARTAEVDAIVNTTAAACLPSTAAIAAVGGYGRRELFPFSDIDLLIVVENEAALLESKTPISDLVRVLWDSGLKVSQSVRTRAECCRLNEQNAELHISLLDLRFVAGDNALFGRLQEDVAAFSRGHSARLVRSLSDLARQRHAKFGNTAYHLEPNIKEAPGTIRDIHLLNWLARLLPDKDPMHDGIAQSACAKQFLFSMRCFLHALSCRDDNLLTFERQDEAAASLPETPISPEEWMRAYYRHSRSIFESSLRALEFAESGESSLVRQFRYWRSRLSTADFTVSHDRLFLRNPAATLSSPESVLQLFAFIARHGVELSWDARHRVQSAAHHLAPSFARQPAPYKSWHDVLSQPHAAAALHEMKQTGILAAAIPAWHEIDSLVVRDFYHRYTVDEHTLVAIEVIDKLLAQSPDGPQRFRELALEIDDPAILRLAILFHDLGKGTTPGAHVQGSLAAASAFLEEIDAPSQVSAAILFLIKHHLDLSSVMNARDLDDPATARFLSSRIGTPEDLRRLALLTYADISAVNPAAMTPWRIEQLWRAYSIAADQLTRELMQDRIHLQTEPPPQLHAPGIAEFLAGFPTRYLRVHTAEQITRHFALDQQRRQTGVAVEITREDAAYLLTLVAEDRPGLFAAICGALASYGMNILKAEASSNSIGCILDLIRFADPLRTLDLNPDETRRLQWTIECVVRGAIEVPDLLKRRPLPRRMGHTRTRPSVRFDNNASDTSTLIEFTGEDRPGLLFDLASALSAAGCNIELVLVDTEAHRALDVFYVTNNGTKLDEPTQAALFKALADADESR